MKTWFFQVYPFFLIILFAVLTPIIIKKGLKKITEISFFANNKKSKTYYSIISSFITYLIYFIALVLLLKELEVDLTPVLASAGVLTIIIGFSTQSILKDVFTGVLMVFENQINSGDLIQLNDGTRGTVEDIGLRTLGIRDWNMRKVYIPYSEIKKVINFNKDQGRVIVKATIPYEVDPAIVERIFTNVSAEMNEIYKEYLIVKPVQIQKDGESIYEEEFQYGGLLDLNEISLIGSTYCIKGLINSDDVFNCKSFLRTRVLQSLAAEGIRPAVPRTIVYKD